ncbi:hypothetical protein O181_045603 [Austropuccinia psidii MF-1]|uniref:Retropepsins domain-containing protein n=1 Tax=Austropuccinia psidii MF-1 TaxID=1389203 RepID=A0A9Q3DSD7_9BASI|nr:hypothetical protein [Austropuccinia psidii MF-1]
MVYIYGTATNITVWGDNSKHPLIIDSGAHFSTLAKRYLEKNSPNLESQLFSTKAKKFKIASGSMTSKGSIITEIIIPQRKGKIRPNVKFVILESTHIQQFLLGADYQRMYGIYI